MAIQDDLDAVIHYAEHLGVSVEILRQYKDNDRAAEVCFYDFAIRVWIRSDASKKAVLSSILHELAHLEGYLGRPKDYTEYFRVSNLQEPTRQERYEVYKIEKRDVSKMVEIADRLGLGIDRGYLRANADLDIWQYWYWWKKGTFPSSIKKKSQQILFARKYKLKFRLLGH